MSSAVFQGVIHGKTIELEQEPGLPDGQKVAVIVEPAAASASSPTSAEAREALRRAAGTWADDADELDKFLQWNRERRKSSRREIPE